MIDKLLLFSETYSAEHRFQDLLLKRAEWLQMF